MTSTAPISFEDRHIGISKADLQEMLQFIGVDTLDQLIDETIPASIRNQSSLNIPAAESEYKYLEGLKKIALKNKLFKSYIGLGYYGTITPSVILRNIFQNPGWYTQYTPYQAEIAQGRLEALLNFQTMVSDLTGLPIANASLLDEGTAAAEAMAMFFSAKNKKTKNATRTQFFVDNGVYPQTVEVLKTRAEPLGIEVILGNWKDYTLNEYTFGVLLQYPDMDGVVHDYRAFAAHAKSMDISVTVAADIMSLVLLTPPGEWGADAAVGNTQRFGVPMGYGGPHAAYFATLDEYKRQIPGRIIGVSLDRHGRSALRMALQTREQHIRREKATSNICTAQALLAIIAGMYAVYHGPEGLKYIAGQIHEKAKLLYKKLDDGGFKLLSPHFFDTIALEVSGSELQKIKELTEQSSINLGYGHGVVRIALDETHTEEDVNTLAETLLLVQTGYEHVVESKPAKLHTELLRNSEFLTHPVFHIHHTESNMMRYIKRLENKDLSLVHSMIALGSCTMKLNAASELIPVSWENFANIHPFVPIDQTKGYLQIFEELSRWLCECTGFTACSLQPNSGAQGEYAGLMTIRAYHQDKGDLHRNINLIPSSAHGTNPASAIMAGMEVVVVKCDEKGNIDIDDLRLKAEEHKDNLSALMVTYPSTHGVFEEGIQEICKIIHDNGGLVYMDGANMNAQVGLTSPGMIGADVCHLNLHKTFAIPHGGGGPGMGPICCNDKLAPYLPGHVFTSTGGHKGIKAVSSAPWGSASILLISYGYIKMLGASGVTNATKYAILNANYMKKRLEEHFKILYVGSKGRAAHEMIIDLNPFKPVGVSAEDVAKRLMDYGFHSPTLSFPVAGTLMIEPTESESKDELDRFCDAMIAIKAEIDEIASGIYEDKDNVLVNAPHTAVEVTANEWNHSYSREKASYPLEYLREGYKFWPSVGRIDSAYGDRNLICTCPPLEAYA
jgi:glycine dehydrogenase